MLPLKMRHVAAMSVTLKRIKRVRGVRKCHFRWRERRRERERDGSLLLVARRETAAWQS